MTTRIIDSKRLFIDYRLNQLGIRVWEDRCQLISKMGSGWHPIGDVRNLPVHVPRTREEVRDARADTIRLTAYQYIRESRYTDLDDLLGGGKSLSETIRESKSFPLDSLAQPELSA